ncbi:MAG: hypothetical protein AB7I38_11565 [Dehalococcoidia bacterium]
MSEQTERFEVVVDATTAAVLRRHCAARGRRSLGDAAADVLQEIARRELLGGLPGWQAAHAAEIVAAVEDGEAALAEAS